MPMVAPYISIVDVNIIFEFTRCSKVQITCTFVATNPKPCDADCLMVLFTPIVENVSFECHTYCGSRIRIKMRCNFTGWSAADLTRGKPD